MNIAPLFDLTGKVAVVTGGGNGIGRASARILAQAGADVVIADMKQDDAQQVADEIETTGRRAIASHATSAKRNNSRTWLNGRSMYSANSTSWSTMSVSAAAGARIHSK